MTINLFGFFVNIYEIPTIIVLFLIILTDFCFNGTKILIQMRKSYNAYFIFISLFICSILLSSISAVEMSLILKSFFKWIEIFIISIIVFLFVRSSIRFKFIYWLIFISTFSSIIFVIIKIIIGDYYVFDYRIFPSYDSLFSFALIIPFLNSVNKKMAIFFSTFFLISAILSQSRGVLIGIIILSVYFYRYYKDKSIIKIITYALLISVIAIFYFEPIKQLIIYRIAEIKDLNNISNVERISMIKYSLLGFSNSPIWGIGALNFPHFILQEGFTQGIVAKDITILEPHNFFLQTLTEEGIIGFTFILLFFLNIFIILYKNNLVLSSNRSNPNLYLLGLRFLFVAIMINLILGFIANQFRFNFALFLGLILSFTRLNSDEPYKEKNRIVRL